jgi:hypothetical protein
MQPVTFTEESLYPFDAPVALQTEIIGNVRGVGRSRLAYS